jgi:DNA-binding transcriptional LysR family regulator
MKTMFGQADRVLVFNAIAEEGTFTKAAARLGCSKAHVSTQLGLLESYLGVLLVHRTTRHLSLTEAGVLYSSYARQMRETLVEAEGAVSATRLDVSGPLKITIPTSLGESVLPELVLEFCNLYPRVEPIIDMSVVHRNLLQEGYDVAFRLTNSLEDNFVARTIGAAREVIVATPALLAAHAPIVAPGHLAGVPCLLNHHFAGEHTWIFQRDADTEAVKVSGSVMVNTYQGVHRFARLGAGVARLPRYMVADDLAAGRLAAVLSDWHTTPLPLYLLFPAQRHLPLRTRKFIDFATAWFAQPERAAAFG